MNPLLRSLDELFYAPYGDSEIKPGDVVVINAPTGKTIIHRVVSASEKGITTMGDNTHSPDSWILRPEQIAGKVAYASRGKRQFTIHGGFPGRIYAAHIRIANRTAHMFCNAVGPIILSPVSGYIQRLVTPRLRVLAFRKPDGMELQLICWKYAIGKRKPGKKWQIRQPFRIFMREEGIEEQMGLELNSIM